VVDVYLRLVATRRASWLGLMAMGALVVAGCSTVQTTPATTSSTITTSNTTTTATTTPVGGAGVLASFTYRPASTPVVSSFVSEVSSREGSRQAFVATYREYDASRPARTFLYAQQPVGDRAVVPEWSGDSAYFEHSGGKSLEFVQREGQGYECLRARPHAHWSCEGPNLGGSIGNIFQTELFQPQPFIEVRMAGPTGHAQIASGTFYGYKVTCLRYLSQVGHLAMWCVTGHGITAFESADDWTMEIISFSATVPSRLFALPARPTRWHEWARWP